MKFTEKIWYESNACWGWVETIKDLIEKCNHQTSHYGAFENVEQFLDRSKENPIDEYEKEKRYRREYLDFGSRREHGGNRTLRMYLKEINMLDAFLEAYNEPEKFKLNNKLKKLRK